MGLRPNIQFYQNLTRGGGGGVHLDKRHHILGRAKGRIRHSAHGIILFAKSDYNVDRCDFGAVGGIGHLHDFQFFCRRIA